MVDDLFVTDRRRERTHALRDLILGCPAFLVCGGPSARSLPLDDLQKRGVFSLAVNNMAAYARTNAFVCSDPPSKFHNGVFLDPSVIKFIPIPKLSHKRGGLRESVDGKIIPMVRDGKPVTTEDAPNVWGFARHTWWTWGDEFFLEESASWGNGGVGEQRTGHPKTLCTMLCALRILYYLGARVIFLVGVDFDMSADTGYAFDQGRTAKAAGNNNAQYRVVNEGLCSMVSTGVFERFGLSVFNCNADSGLRAFPHISFSDAVAYATSRLPPTPFDTAGWYEKTPAELAPQPPTSTPVG